jgi:hypothetical protein
VHRLLHVCVLPSCTIVCSTREGGTLLYAGIERISATGTTTVVGQLDTSSGAGRVGLPQKMLRATVAGRGSTPLLFIGGGVDSGFDFGSNFETDGRGRGSARRPL